MPSIHNLSQKIPFVKRFYNTEKIFFIINCNPLYCHNDRREAEDEVIMMVIKKIKIK